MDREASAFVATALLGLLIRLANDWALLDSWSSGTDFCRCVAREPGIRVGCSAAASRVVLVLKVEYCVLVFDPPVVREAGPREASREGGFRGIVFRTIGPFCDVFCWSNFFFKSFTLWCATPPYPATAAVDVPVVLLGLSSTGLEGDRNVGRTPLLRAAKTGGCLGVVPLVVARREEVCRRLGIAEAMEEASLGGDEGCWLAFTVCTPR